MRCERLGATALAVGGILVAGAAWAAAGPDSTRAAGPDSARAVAADSLPGGAPARPGGLLPFRLLPRASGRGLADTSVSRSAGTIRSHESPILLNEGRKWGEETLGGALLGRRPVLIDPLPVFGVPIGSVRLPDGGAVYRTEDRWLGAEGATDRSLVRLGARGGIAGLAATLDDPEGTGADVLDDAELLTPVAPAALHGASDALALLTPRSDADPLLKPGVPVPPRFRTTLVYRKGDGDEQVTGARFFSPTIGRGLMGSFSRHAAGGVNSISESVSSRYRVTAGLPRALNHTLSLEGRLFQRTISMPLADLGAEARAEMTHASLAFQAESRSGSRNDRLSLALRRQERTDVSAPDTPRERWDVPELALQGDAAWGDSLGGTVLAGVRTASTRVSYRTDGTQDFRRRIESARFTLGARRPLGPGGVGVDAAYDLTGRQGPEWDARASGWAAARGAAARLDLESVHERPTWIDLWTPPRADTVSTDTSTLLFSRSGNPSLRARRLTGGTGRAVLHLGDGWSLVLSGAAHRVTRDFGWTVEPVAAATPWDLVDRASERGEGWVSFASLSLAGTAGPLRGRALGWIRDGSGRLTPLAGSPPRRAADVEADVRQRLFGGDLLARLSAAVHVLGPREGLIREPAQAVWDGALHLDFGAAAAVLGFSNVFDRRVGSGVYDAETGLAEPLPGRTFHFGVVWDLLD